jgi:hypothetical protein
MKKVRLSAIAVLLLLAPLAAATITVISPNGGETMVLGQTWPIAWTATGVNGNVKIQLIKPGGALIGVIAPSLAHGSSPFPWTIGLTSSGMAAAGNYKVRVISLDGSVMDESNNLFTLADAVEPPQPGGKPTIVVTSPNGGESWPYGREQPVTWEYTGMPATTPVKMLLYSDQGEFLCNLSPSLTVGQGTVLWRVGMAPGIEAVPYREGYKIRVSTLDDATFGQSANPFKIFVSVPPPATPSITVRSPNTGSENMEAGRNWFIDWGVENISQNVRIVLVTADGADVGVIAENIGPEVHPFLWTIGKTLSGTAAGGKSYRVRVLTMDGSVQDASDNPFTIRDAPRLVVMAPIHDRLPPLLPRPKLAVTAIDLLPNPEAYFIVFGFKNAGNAPLPPASEFPLKPDFKVVIDGREIGRGDLNVPNEALAPGAEIKQTLGGFIKFPAAGDPWPFCLGDQITITLNERNVLGLGSASKTSSLRLIALHNFYDLALNPVTYDWYEGVAHLLVTKVGGGSPPRSKKFVLNYTIRGYHPAGTVEHDWNEGVVDTPGPFTWKRTRTILGSDTFPVHVDLPLSKTYSTFYELEFEIKPEFRDEFDERNNTLPPVRFDRPN